MTTKTSPRRYDKLPASLADMNETEREHLGIHLRRLEVVLAANNREEAIATIDAYFESKVEVTAKVISENVRIEHCGFTPRTTEILIDAGYETAQQVAMAKDKDLLAIKQIGKDLLVCIRKKIPRKNSLL